jgi:hypothetical protein
MPAQRRFSFHLAEEHEDEELRALLRQIAMPGAITLSFQREPSFIQAEQAGNITSQIIVCKDQQRGQIVGMGSRSIRLVYIDGKPERIGYLSMLRSLPEVRGNIGLARGYHYLHELHKDNAVPYYFTTILDENIQASTLLTSSRAGLPCYRPVAHLHTYLIPLRSTLRRKRSHKAINRCEPQQLTDAAIFLQHWNSQLQFAPVYSLADLNGQSKLLPFFSWENIYVYYKHKTVQGVLGVWDQQAFKQTIVSNYSPEMRTIRTVYNLFASVRGLPGLPAVGQGINMLYAMFVSGNSQVFAALLEQLLLEWSGKGYDYLSVGVCRDNELATVAARYATHRLLSTAYMVFWPEEDVVPPQGKRPVHLEIATL